MNAKTKINLKGDGIIEIAEELLEDEVVDYGIVSGYWRSDGQCHSEQLEPYFYLSVGGRVQVTTRTYGSLRVTLNFFNDSANHGGPRLPQEGGTTSLGPGQWRMYFTGWIETLAIKSGIEVSVLSSGIAVQGEAVEPEEEIEEERGTIFKARARGSSRPQAIRIAYRRADKHAAGKPYRIIEERVYAEAGDWVCILTCELT
jgi:hypothetical protein